LRMEIDPKSKTVHLWLSSTEHADPAVLGSLKPLYQRFREQKYLVAVFLSGQSDLYGQTWELLRHNRRKLAAVGQKGSACLPSVFIFRLLF